MGAAFQTAICYLGIASENHRYMQHYDQNKYTIHTWKSTLGLFWILNPGSAINELIFGQRLPKVFLQDRDDQKPLVERSVIPCPHCQTLHDGRIWMPEESRAFKNWFGLYCPNCGGVIPCLWSLTSWLLLAITFPLWGWFRKAMYRRWLAAQPARYEHIDLSTRQSDYDKKNWVVSGLSFGMLLYFAMAIVWPMIQGDLVDMKSLLRAAPIYIVGGLVYGYVMKWYMSRKGKGEQA